MRALILSVSAVACVVSGFSQIAQAGDYDAMIARHAAANGLPPELVRRVMMKESGGRSHIVSAGNYGLMQIRHGTARGVGYSGSAAGLLDPETNMTYAAKYLAGAYRAAGGNQDRAVSYYQRGYYYAAKRQGLTQVASAPTAIAPSFSLASAPVAAPIVQPVAKVVPVAQPVVVMTPMVVPVADSPRAKRNNQPLNLFGHLKQSFKSNAPASERRRLAKRDDAIQEAEMVRQQTQRDARPDLR